MGRFQAAALLLLPLGLLLRPPSYGHANNLNAEEACADFRPGKFPGSAWTFDDCVEVWKRYARTISSEFWGRMPHVDTWRQTASELRRVGSPCLVASDHVSDGAGSSAIRHIATWTFAEEIGCDWVTPHWDKKAVPGGNGAVLYCHRTATTAEMDLAKSSKEMRAMRHCSIINFLAYFQFAVPSVDLPEKGTTKVIQVELNSTKVNEIAKKELQNTGLAKAPYPTVVFTFHPTFASEHLSALGSWDEARLTTVRKVLHEARQNFHRHPRPWYEENPECAYDSARLNVAIHVRMGDRRAYQDGSLDYFRLLGVFMDTVSQEVVGMGLESPMFHIFSETLVPCPSDETGLFDEFPTWPVKLDQIPACLEAKAPDDCHDKKAESFCRFGMFHVAGMPIVLHVGPDVQNAMSCMIQADAVLMGCSTFGQVAGILTKGISLFSTSCDGARTPDQYKTTPPLALAERGYLWVPVAGSWRDPVLESTEILRGALNELMATSVGLRL